MDPKKLRNQIQQLAQSGGKVPALRLISDKPDQAAVLSKLLVNNQPTFQIDKKNAEQGLNAAQLATISDSIKSRLHDNENIMGLFPDIELAVQILVSSILSPKDMVKTDLIYKTTKAIFPSEVLNQLNTVIEDEVDTHYRFKDDLQEIIRDALFEKGAHARVILPESIVDSMINQGTSISKESLVDIFEETSSMKIRNLGILGPGIKSDTKKRTHALESFFGKDFSVNHDQKVYTKADDGKEIALEHLEVSDNFQFLKVPKLIQTGNRLKIKEITKTQRNFAKAFSVATENVSNKKLSSNELSQLLYKSTPRDYENLMVLPSSYNTKRKSIGRPLEMKLPVESLIPVHVPGDPSKHVGYFMMTDIDGHPITKDMQKNDTHGGIMGLLSPSAGGGQNMSSLLLERAKKNLKDSGDVPPSLDNLADIYASIVERDLIERLNNGVYGTNATISANKEIYRIMLARAIQAKMTRLIYIPIEFVSYFAFKYFSNGVGKSYLDDVKNLTSIRAILLFAKTMAQVKSAINVTKITMNLDPNDPDPMKSIEEAQHEVAKMRQMYFPFGINSPVDLTDWITRAGMEWSFKNHPGLPETSFEFQSDNFKHDIPDDTLDENLRKQTYMSFGLSPEMVDNGFNTEFATTAIHNNILMAKRISNLQDIFLPQGTEHVCRIARHDEVVRERLVKILIENKEAIKKHLTDEEAQEFADDDDNHFAEMMLDYYLEYFTIELPRPDITSLETQTEAFNSYTEALDKALDYWISDKTLDASTFGGLAENVEKIKEMVRSLYIRRWMAANNYLPELNDLVTADDENKAIVDVLQLSKDHAEALLRSLAGLYRDVDPIKGASDKDAQKFGAGSGDSFSSTSETPEDNSMGLDDTLGGTDNFDEVPSGADTEVPEETEEKEEPSSTSEEPTDQLSQESIKENITKKSDGTVIFND